MLALIMFGIGASLQLKDFNNVFFYPKALTAGLSLQMIFLPIFFFAVAWFAPISPTLKVGLFILSLCPGGTTSNFISYLVRAEVALSISLTIINSVLILFTIPALTSLGLSYFMGTEQQIQIPVLQTITQIFLLTLFPSLVGLGFNQSFPMLSARIKQPLKYINILLLGLVFGIKFFAGESQGGSGISVDDILIILPYALLTHLGSMIFSYYFAKSINIDNRNATTIGIEVGLQNTALALLITGTLLGNNEMTRPALVFAIFSFFTTLAFAWLAMRKDKTVQKAAL
jgi:BASS family bile acid:Na+ symporter